MRKHVFVIVLMCACLVACGQAEIPSGANEPTAVSEIKPMISAPAAPASTPELRHHPDASPMPPQHLPDYPPPMPIESNPVMPNEHLPNPPATATVVGNSDGSPMPVPTDGSLIVPPPDRQMYKAVFDEVFREYAKSIETLVQQDVLTQTALLITPPDAPFPADLAAEIEQDIAQQPALQGFISQSEGGVGSLRISYSEPQANDGMNGGKVPVVWVSMWVKTSRDNECYGTIMMAGYLLERDGDRWAPKHYVTAVC